MKLIKCSLCFTIYGNNREHCPTCGCLKLHGFNYNHETKRVITRRVYKSVSRQYPSVSAQ